MRLLPVLLAVSALLLVTAGPASAVVAPRDCGFLSVKGKRYNVKADQLSCSTGRRHARRYLQSGSRPSGYRCKNYPASQTAKKFSCKRGIREFYAVRR